MITARAKRGAIGRVASLVTLLAAVGWHTPNVGAQTPLVPEVGAREAPPFELGSGVIDPDGRYLVSFANAAGMERGRAEFHDNGLRPEKVAELSMFVLAVDADASQLTKLEHRPDVVAVEPERRYELLTDQPSPPWGLDRIDQRNLPLSSNYSYGGTGSGVVIYTIDSGIWFSHDEFTGRVPRSAFWQFNDGYDEWDCNGHGTHVAGIAAGTTYGVAKGASIVPVKALSCSGSTVTSILVDAIDWIVADHNFGTPAVVNMSLGGPASATLDSAVQSMITDGITVVAAAGNDSADSCLYSPGRVADVITVAASTSVDDDAAYSNFGVCNDLFAPGSDIPSAWWGSDSAARTMSGTSMAAPHVAGAAALVLQGDPSSTPSMVWSTIDNNATVGALTECCGDPDKLLYVSPPVLGEQLLSVSRLGGGVGTVWSSPSGIDCGLSCSGFYANGTSVVLAADATVGSVFTGWSGACTGTSTCVVSMTTPRSVTATFTKSGSLTPVVPARLLETRSGLNETTVDHLFEGIGPQGAGMILELQVTGRGGVPVDADAVMLNVTAVFPDAAGFLTVFPCGGALPHASNVNYVVGGVVANAVLAKVGTGGKVCIYTKAATDIVADVNGYVA